jgi:hypothetical protein
MPKDVIDLPVMGRAAALQSVNEDARTVEVVWTTGSQVRRYSWMRDEEFDEELVVEPSALRLERMNSGAPFLESHNAYSLRSVLGVVVEGSVRIEGGKGYATVRISDRDEVEPIWRDIKAGIIRNVSAGYRVHKFERVAKADRTDGGQRALYRAVDWEPMEISAVAIGADPGAHIRSNEPSALAPCVIERRDNPAAAAARAEEAAMPKENQNAAGGDAEAVRGAGQASGTTQTTEATTASEARGQQPDVQAAAREAVEAERKRAGDIRALCKRHGLSDTFTEGLVNDGSSIEKARNAVLDELAKRDADMGRTYEPAPAQARGTGERDVAYRDAVTSSLLHRHNPGLHQLAEDGREFRGMTLLELARSVLERHGISTRGMSKMEVAASAFQMRAGIGYHSTSDFPAILANVASKTLRAAYESTQRTFIAWARRATITDFKPVSRTQLGGAPDLTKVLESGEFQYGTIGEAKEIYALATYGRVVAITRQTLINDDLDAFTRLPAAFGASAADLESDIVYSILMDNPVMGDNVALFHDDHGNLGTAAVVSEASLSEAYRKMAQQKGLEGRLIRVMPASIIVPPGTRAVEARKQLTATTPANTQDVNTYANRLQVVEEPRLIPASGQDPWFLAADPNRIDTVEFAYLDGQEGVFTETRMAESVRLPLSDHLHAVHAVPAVRWHGLS